MTSDKVQLGSDFDVPNAGGAVVRPTDEETLRRGLCSNGEEEEMAE